MQNTSRHRLWSLLRNSRFWILASGVVLAVNVAGLAQLIIPAGPLQLIRIEQAYGFGALICAYLAALAVPLTQAWPKMPLGPSYLSVRHDLVILAFIYALMHVGLAFFWQLGGFAGLPYLGGSYRWAVACGVVALSILATLAAMSISVVARRIDQGRWHILRRLAYVAAAAIVIHILIIGPHFLMLSPVGIVTYAAIALLFALETLRIYRAVHLRRAARTATR